MSEEEKKEEMDIPPTPEEVEEEIEKLTKKETKAEKEAPESLDIDKLIQETPAEEKAAADEAKESAEIEAPVSLEEQETIVAEDIKEAGEEIRKDVWEADKGKSAELAKAAAELEDEAFGEAFEDEGKISGAAGDEEAALEKEVEHKEEFFRKKYIDDIKEEIGHVKEEIIGEMARPRPEKIQQIREEVKGIEKEYRTAAKGKEQQSNVLKSNDPSKLFEELKRRGTLRGVKVSTGIPKAKPTPEDIIRKSLKEDKQQKVPSAWELLQRKKIKDSK
jgi:hypothetical protein